MNERGHSGKKRIGTVSRRGGSTRLATRTTGGRARALAVLALSPWFAASCSTSPNTSSPPPEETFTGDFTRGASQPITESAARVQRAACAYTAGQLPGATVALYQDDAKTIPIPVGSAMPIQYVFVLMMENRSFDNYYGRFQAYLQKKGYTDVRVNPYVDQNTPDGIDVPGTPYDQLSPAARAQEDTVLSQSGYNSRTNAPWNPDIAGQNATSAAQKHYWRHANGDGDQCLADTCHEWWCSHLSWDDGAMDGFFEANDGYWEGGEPNVGYPPSTIPANYYSNDPTLRTPNSPSNGSLLRGDRALIYYNESDIPFYYWTADAFAIADRYHASAIGPTYINRDFLYGATSRGLTTNSSDYYGASATDLTHPSNLYAGKVAANPPAQTFNKTTVNTIYDNLTAGGVKYTQWVRNRYSNVTAPARWGTWYGATAVASSSTKYTYDSQTGGGSGFEYYVNQENSRLVSAIKGGSDPTTLKAQGSSFGGIYPVNFIDPDSLEDVNGEDEHPPGTPQMGQRVSYDVVRVLMANPEVWKRSVLFITYDEHGGLYDHVTPPPACAPDAINPTWSGAYGGGVNTPYSDPTAKTPRLGENGQTDTSDSKYGGHFDHFGVRVPLLVISPWAKHQYVSHYTYDHTSIVRFLETRFGLPAMTNRDANADPLLDFFDFSNGSAKLRGTAAAPKGCIACKGGWGTEALPTDAMYHDASLLQSNRYTLTANSSCLALFPPVSNPGTAAALGASVYGAYDWSAGKAPPASYISDPTK